MMTTCIVPIPPPLIHDEKDTSNNRLSSTSLTRSAKIEDRLNKAIDKSIPTKNRSSELVPLTAEYERMKKQLRTLLVSAKAYQQHMNVMQQSRKQFMEQMSVMADGTPLSEYLSRQVGDDSTFSNELQQLFNESNVSATLPQNGDGSSNNNNNRSISSRLMNALEQHRSTEGYQTTNPTNDKIISLYTLIHTCGGILDGVNNSEYQSLVIEYVTDWERIVTDKVDKMLREVRKLETSRRHYEHKVNHLRTKCNCIDAKGKKPCPQPLLEKLSRNENKLRQSFSIHEREAGKLCTLLEAVTYDGHKELYTLIKNFVKWDLNTTRRDTDLTTYVATTFDSLTTYYGRKKKMFNRAAS